MTTPPAEATLMTPTTTAGTPEPVYLPDGTTAPAPAGVTVPSREDCLAALKEARADLPPAMQRYPVTCSHTKHADDAPATEVAAGDAEPV